jgi:Ca2+/Na+ antiporter
MGAAFGLFAVFGMLRYRTEDLSIKDMTYLFLVIAIGLMTAVIKLEDIAYYYEFVFIIVVNAFVLLLTYLLESNALMKQETAKQIIYENIELIKPEKRNELMADLESRTGQKINRISIGRIDFLRDTALIKIYFYEE